MVDSVTGTPDFVWPKMRSVIGRSKDFSFGAPPERHRVDDQFAAAKLYHHHFEQVPAPGRADDEVARRIVIQLHPGRRPCDRVLRVRVRDAVPSGSGVNLHTQ